MKGRGIPIYHTFIYTTPPWYLGHYTPELNTLWASRLFEMLTGGLRTDSESNDGSGLAGVDHRETRGL